MDFPVEVSSTYICSFWCFFLWKKICSLLSFHELLESKIQKDTGG